MDKSKTYQNQLNKLLERYKKGYITEPTLFEKINVVKSAGYKIDFEVNRLFEFDDFEFKFFYGIQVSQNRPINISLYSILKIFVSKSVD